ncbi:MAG: APC family permease, partial [Steroidobacteraceae bacterium]
AYGLGASLLNFGALIAFMGVNAAAFVRCYRDASRNRLTGLLIPLVGAGVCAVLWWNLSIQARIFGAVWTTIGLVYGAIQTKGFKLDVMRFKIPGDPW